MLGHPDPASMTSSALRSSLEDEIRAKQAEENGITGNPFGDSDDDDDDDEKYDTKMANAALQNDGYGRSLLQRARAEPNNPGNAIEDLLLRSAGGQGEQNPTLLTNNARAFGVNSASDVNRETFHEDITAMDSQHNYINPRLPERRFDSHRFHSKEDALKVLVGEGPFINRTVRDPLKHKREYERVVKGQWGNIKGEWEQKNIPIRQNMKWPVQRQSESERILADRFPEYLNPIRKPRYNDISGSGAQQQMTTMPTGWFGFLRNLPLWTTLQKPQDAILNVTTSVKETTKERESRLQSERPLDARGFYTKNIKNTEFPRDKRPTDEYTTQWRMKNFEKLKSRTMRNDVNPHVAFFQAQTGTRRIALEANPNSASMRPESLSTMHPASARQERYTDLNEMFASHPHPGPLTNAMHNKMPFAGEKTLGTFDKTVFQRGENWMRQPILHSRIDGAGGADRNRPALNTGESLATEIPYDKIDRHVSGGDYGPLRAQMAHPATGVGVMGSSGANASNNSSGALSTMLHGLRKAVGKIYFPMRKNTDPYDTRDNQNERGEWNSHFGTVTAANAVKIAKAPENNVEKTTRSLMMRSLRDEMNYYRDPALV